jgi:hypothetical protein
METQQQEMTMTKAEPQKEHEWLQVFVGEWTLEHDDKAAEAGQSSGAPWIETVRSLHGIWILFEGQGEMPGGGPATTIMTLGYDPAKQRYVGTWLGSMMTHLWVYEGTLDPTGKILTLETEGHDFGAGGKMAKYKDVITLESNDHRILTSHMLGDDGEWREFMTAHYRRKK